MEFITQQYKQTRQDLLETLKMLPPAKENEIVTGEWTARDVISHLIGWDQHTIELVEAVFEGEQLETIEDEDEYNQKVILENQQLTWEELVERFEDNSAHLLQSFEFMDEGMWSMQPYTDNPKSVQDILLDKVSHYKVHFAEIAKLV